MPHYDYFCTHCKYNQEDVFQKITDRPLTQCPQCQNFSYQKKLSAGIGVQFHGSGFYETDYGSKKSEPKDKSQRSFGCGKNTCS